MLALLKIVGQLRKTPSANLHGCTQGPVCLRVLVAHMFLQSYASSPPSKTLSLSAASACHERPRACLAQARIRLVSQAVSACHKRPPCPFRSGASACHERPPRASRSGACHERSPRPSCLGAACHERPPRISACHERPVPLGGGFGHFSQTLSQLFSKTLAAGNLRHSFPDPFPAGNLFPATFFPDPFPAPNLFPSQFFLRPFPAGNLFPGSFFPDPFPPGNLFPAFFFPDPFPAGNLFPATFFLDLCSGKSSQPLFRHLSQPLFSQTLSQRETFSQPLFSQKRFPAGKGLRKKGLGKGFPLGKAGKRKVSCC